MTFFGLLPKLDGLAGQLPALCGHWPLGRDAAVWPVEGDIRCKRESAALWFHLCSSLMVIDKVGL